MTGELVQQSWRFGTAPDCEVRVTDDYVSRYHCLVELHGDGHVTITDLGSVNGTWVRSADERPVHGYGARVWDTMRITPPCIIRIGHTDIPWRRP